MTAIEEGWGVPGGSRKFHYFRGSMALCRKWGFYFGPLSPDQGGASKDDCVACRKALDKERSA